MCVHDTPLFPPLPCPAGCVGGAVGCVGFGCVTVTSAGAFGVALVVGVALPGAFGVAACCGVA